MLLLYIKLVQWYTFKIPHTWKYKELFLLCMHYFSFLELRKGYSIDQNAKSLTSNSIKI